MSPLDVFSDAELITRLIQRGINPELAEARVERRQERLVAEWIAQVLDL